MRLLVLPGLDGTGELHEAFTAALPVSSPATVLAYPREELLGYEQLLDLVVAALPAGERVVIVAAPAARCWRSVRTSRRSTSTRRTWCSSAGRP